MKNAMRAHYNAPLGYYDLTDYTYTDKVDTGAELPDYLFILAMGLKRLYPETGNTFRLGISEELGTRYKMACYSQNGEFLGGITFKYNRKPV